MNKDAKKYEVVKQLNLPGVDKDILAFWKEADIFARSMDEGKGKTPFVFYEGPPSANGMPGIHHVMARAIKDLFCRYKTMQGFLVERKGGWDTHGLPIELQVEKELGIHKEDIGVKITVEEYNAACRKEVMKFKEVWDDLTVKMGYWVDLDDPYLTFTNDYIETLWHLLQRLFDRGFLYKGYTVQPFSPAAGTGLSSHELNMPGTYREVKDVSITAQFKLEDEDTFVLAWTTTPWTLPSNTALAVGKNIDYVKVATFNPYTKERIEVILAEKAVSRYFSEEDRATSQRDLTLEEGQKNIPFFVLEQFKGSALSGKTYEQLMPYAQPEEGKAFVIVTADYVTTEDGTGIVHQAPSFGADDMRTAQIHGIGALTMVDKQGRFTEQMGEFAHRPVKDFYDDEGYVDVNIDIAVKLKKENRAFQVKKYEHNYPHCWRTDKPILYYPLDSWFIKTTAVKDRLVELNKTINWKPASTGSGRFGNWLENLVDWNLSRSRFWGTPLPIWMSEDKEEIRCIGSMEELQEEVKKSVAAGFMAEEIDNDFDLHKPYVDNIILCSDSGKPMKREADLIDVWFDSGAMPYAQWHYPFSTDNLEGLFPADFIAEGVDQTRGWFFTLHTIATMLFDNVAFKNVVSNGLVLDKEGNKMSKRLGNAVDPFKTIETYGADATRWYIISNSQPWDNLKFDLKGIEEVQRKFFGTLMNTYSFFALYANIDNFNYSEDDIAAANRPRIDRWILSLLNSLTQEVEDAYEDYEPTKAARAIQSFVTDNLSNWYVRLSRRRFWKGDYAEDKISAYQTLYTCLDTLSRLMAPIAPFYSEYLYRQLNLVSRRHEIESVHLSTFPKANQALINRELEAEMQLAQDVSSLVLSLRKGENIKVRQPLQRILLPVDNAETKLALNNVKDLILSEVNVKDIQFVDNTEGMVTKSIKPNFSVLGRKLGQKMKAMSHAISLLSQEDISQMEAQGNLDVSMEGEVITLSIDEVEIASKDMEGWLVASNERVTVALDVHISDDLKMEGYARELVNRIQNLRKESNFDVTDRINVKLGCEAVLESAVLRFKDYISVEVLAEELEITRDNNFGTNIEVNDLLASIELEKA